MNNRANTTFLTIAGLLVAFIVGVFLSPQLRNLNFSNTVGLVSPTPGAQDIAQATASPTPQPTATTQADAGIGGVAAPKTVTFQSLNDSGITGTATLQDLEGERTIVTIVLSGTTAGARLPAHIHTGSCDALGDIRYPLEPIVNGRSVTTLNGNIDDLTEQASAINVHRSTTRMTEVDYVACGDIDEPGLL